MSPRPLDARAVLRDRVRRWIGILSAYLSAQSLLQLLGIATGILFIRTMPVREFALYTLSLSVITFFTFVSDLGSTTSLLYFFHRTAKEGESFQPYYAAVLSLRRAAFLAGAGAVVLAFPRAAAAKGFGTRETVLATLAVLLAVWFQIGASLRLLALRLADRYGESYRAEIAGSGVRLLFAAAITTASWLYGWLGVFSSSLGTATTVLLTRRLKAGSGEETDLRPYRRQVLRYLLPTLPGALYFSFQGPLTVWLSAIFGAARNIAEVGALSRLGMVVGLLSSLINVVFMPRLAHIADDRLYRVRCLQFGSLLATGALALFSAATLFPGQLLAILGQHYAGLYREMRLVVAGSGLTLLGGFLVSINLARSWNRWQGAAVLLLICVQAGLVAVLPLGTTSGVLLFNVLTALTGLLLQLIITATGFVRPQWVHWT